SAPHRHLHSFPTRRSSDLLIDPMRAHEGHEAYNKINGRTGALGDEAAHSKPERFKGDGTLTFDRLTDVYHSGTRHEEDQPCHLRSEEHTSELQSPCNLVCR